MINSQTNYNQEAFFYKRERLQQLIIAILSSVGAKPHVDQEYMLYLLYYIDFNHYEAHERSITEQKYVKTINGAEPELFREVLQGLINSAQLVEIALPTGTGNFYKLLPTIPVVPGVFTETQQATIKETLDSYSELSFMELKGRVLADTPLMMAEIGGLLDYEYVFYRSDDE